jgi:Spy/CpxP family protein refolding chaperone
MKKMIVILGMVALMAIGASYVYAQGAGLGPGHRMGWGYANWSSLTPEQHTKFQELPQKFNDETAQLRGNILTKRLELQSLWTNPKADPKAILEKEKELTSLQDKMRDKAVQFGLEARSLLTPEQIAQFGSCWGMGRGFGRGSMMGDDYGMGHRYAMGHGGMGPGYGCY